MENTSEVLNLDSKAKSKACKKGEILQREGDSHSQAFFVKKGLLRSYTIDDNGKEHIFVFAPEGWVIGDFDSQESHQPTVLFIDCIEDSEVIILEENPSLYSDLSTDQLQKKVNLLSRRLATLQKRVLMLMSATAKTRYESFLAKYPELPNRIPQRMIASYLGITPQALSTIRGEMTRKK